jgi:cytochrome c oxidase subunit IV
VHPTSHPIHVSTTPPLLRLVLVVVLMLAALAGMLVASGVHAGWLTLGFALVAGPVAVVVEGRSRMPGVTRATSAAPV